jgi:hypothetical protein
MFVCPGGGWPTAAPLDAALVGCVLEVEMQPAALRMVKNAPLASNQRISFQCTSSIFVLADPNSPLPITRRIGPIGGIGTNHPTRKRWAERRRWNTYRTPSRNRLKTKVM